jgi:5-methylcytosine-specific restriction endonuclease McrA
MKVLVLDVGFCPIGVVSWQRAITLAILDRVDVLTAYQHAIRYVSGQMSAPAVIRLRRYIDGVAHSPARLNRYSVFSRDGGKCAYCLIQLSRDTFTYDHIIPKSKGGRTEWTNVVICCVRCNKQKDSLTPEESGLILHTKPYRPTKIAAKLMLNVESEVSSIPPEWKYWLNKE